MSKRKTVTKVNVVDLGALQQDCELATMEFRAIQDLKIQVDRDFAEAKEVYTKTCTALESGLATVITNCMVLNLIKE